MYSLILFAQISFAVVVLWVLCLTLCVVRCALCYVFPVVRLLCFCHALLVICYELCFPLCFMGFMIYVVPIFWEMRYVIVIKVMRSVFGLM